MAFIKCKDVIVNTNDIKSVTAHGQHIFIECANNEYRIYFSSENEVKNELNRIYEILTTMPNKEKL